MRSTSVVIYLQGSLETSPNIISIRTPIATFIVASHPSEITQGEGVTQRGGTRRELGDPKEPEEARFYRRNSINECVDSRPGWSEGRQLASILSIGRRVYGTLIRFVSPSASTRCYGSAQDEGRRESEGVRKSTWRG